MNQFFVQNQAVCLLLEKRRQEIEQLVEGFGGRKVSEIQDEIVYNIPNDGLGKLIAELNKAVP